MNVWEKRNLPKSDSQQPSEGMLLMDTGLIRQLILGTRYSVIAIGKKLKMVKKHIFLLI